MVAPGKTSEIAHMLLQVAGGRIGDGGAIAAWWLMPLL